MEATSQSPDSNKVQVKGFPSYTQPQDLTRVFLAYGTVKVEKIKNNFAVLAFSNADEAKAAVADSGKANIYGEFLSVKHYTGKDKEPTTPKREFPRSKNKDEAIISPKLLDFSGDFHTQLDTILGAVRLTQEEVITLQSLYADVEMALQQTWPGCQTIPFGSITTGLGIKTSDADCFIRVPAELHHSNIVNRAKRILQSYPKLFTEILSIPKANTPIVKFFHVPTQTNCDLTFKTVLGSQNSKLITFLLQADPRLIPMAVFVKYWAKIHGFSGTGKLTNYALTMLIIFYLQQPPLSILPSIQWLQTDPKNDVIVDSWNTGFMDRHELLPQSTNTSSVAELLGGFFQYYSTFNFDEMVICPFIGCPIKKDEFKDINNLPEAFKRYKQNTENHLTPPLNFTRSICVQDPFELCHNVASAINTRLYADIKAFFEFAAAAYDKDKLNHCNDLLKTILLQKPKLARGKSRPEYRAVIYPHIINNILNPDWKAVIRDVMFKIFEQICKIKLTKIEEKTPKGTKRLREKCKGVVTKAIWKRKQFYKLYNFMHLDFLEKQTRITEEVLNVEKKIYNIEFQLTLTFTTEPKNAVGTVKLLEGDLEAFKEFGKFFMTNVQQWFFSLLKSHLKSRENKKQVDTDNKQYKREIEEEFTIEIKETEEEDSIELKDTEEEDSIELKEIEEDSIEVKETEEELTEEVKETEEELTVEAKETEEELTVEVKQTEKELTVEVKETEEELTVVAKETEEELTVEAKETEEELTIKEKETEEELTIEVKETEEKLTIEAKEKANNTNNVAS